MLIIYKTKFKRSNSCYLDRFIILKKYVVKQICVIDEFGIAKEEEAS